MSWQHRADGKRRMTVTLTHKSWFWLSTHIHHT